MKQHGVLFKGKQQLMHATLFLFPTTTTLAPISPKNKNASVEKIYTSHKNKAS